MPTFSYLAYGASGPPVLSLYSFHSDGSGVCHVSSRRPILNLRPKVVENWQGIDLVHMFNADLHLVDWLEAKGFQYDVITDGDLHAEGEELLAPYNVVITGSHPEYWSEQMLDALQDYLSQGGRLMYLGGNGFYWVTSVDPVGGTRSRSGARTGPRCGKPRRVSTTTAPPGNSEVSGVFGAGLRRSWWGSDLLPFPHFGRSREDRFGDSPAVSTHVLPSSSRVLDPMR